MQYEVKGQISHSTVEKQRRDRINSLIDEVRCSVAGISGASSGAGLSAPHGSHSAVPKRSQVRCNQFTTLLHPPRSCGKLCRRSSAAITGQAARAWRRSGGQSTWCWLTP